MLVGLLISIWKDSIITGRYGSYTVELRDRAGRFLSVALVLPSHDIAMCPLLSSCGRCLMLLLWLWCLRACAWFVRIKAGLLMEGRPVHAQATPGGG